MERKFVAREWRNDLEASGEWEGHLLHLFTETETEKKNILDLEGQMKE